MILSLSNQANLFLTTAIVGFFLGFVYDLFRIFRIMFKHNSLAIEIEDIIYWIFVIFVMFLFLLHKNYGEIRFFSIVGTFLGMILYFFTISKIVLKISSAVIKVVKSIILLFLRIILTPFYLVALIFKKPVEKTRNFINKKSSNLLQLFRVYVKISLRKISREIGVIIKKH